MRPSQRAAAAAATSSFATSSLLHKHADIFGREDLHQLLQSGVSVPNDTRLIMKTGCKVKGDVHTIQTPLQCEETLRLCP